MLGIKSRFWLKYSTTERLTVEFSWSQSITSFLSLMVNSLIFSYSLSSFHTPSLLPPLIVFSCFSFLSSLNYLAQSLCSSSAQFLSISFHSSSVRFSSPSQHCFWTKKSDWWWGLSSLHMPPWQHCNAWCPSSIFPSLSQVTLHSPYAPLQRSPLSPFQTLASLLWGCPSRVCWTLYHAGRTFS